MKIRCPHCSQKLEVDNDWAGQEATCPSCNENFVIPQMAAPVIEAEINVKKRPAGNNQLIYDGHPSWWNYCGSFIFGGLFVLMIPGGAVTIPIVLIGCVIIVLAIIKHNTTLYTVTNTKISMRKGLITTKTSEIRICDVRAVEVHRGIIRAGLGFATAGTKGYEIEFRGMSANDADKLKQSIDEIIDQKN